MARLSLLFLLAVLLNGLVPTARASDDTTSQLWADYHAHYYQTATREWFADGGYRIQLQDVNWSQAYVRPSFRFHKYEKFDLYAGLGLFYTNNRGAPDQFEIRPWQGVLFRWPVFDALSFTHFIRFEQRFTVNQAGANTFALRWRYRLGTRIALKKAVSYQVFDPIFMPLSIEIFSDAGEQVDTFFGSRLRIDLGLGYIANDEWVGEFHLIIQDSRSGTDDTFSTTDFIFRFQVKHLIGSKDYRQKQDLPQ